MKKYSDCSLDVHQIVTLERDAKEVTLKPDEEELNHWEMHMVKACQV